MSVCSEHGQESCLICFAERKLTKAVVEYIRRRIHEEERQILEGDPLAGGEPEGLIHTTGVGEAVFHPRHHGRTQMERTQDLIELLRRA